jgi:hypothetical protein
LGDRQRDVAARPGITLRLNLPFFGLRANHFCIQYLTEKALENEKIALKMEEIE